MNVLAVLGYPSEIERMNLEDHEYLALLLSGLDQPFSQ
jgi:hypothetical protein